MPTHFKKYSEYKEKFQPVPSHKSASFVPMAEQAAVAAGQSSLKLGLSMEPPLQHKKRVTGPQVTLNPDFYHLDSQASDDYALLGVNDKFSENVKYKASKRVVSPARTQKPKPKTKENVKPMAKTTPAPVVNTDIYRQSKEESPQVETPLAPRKSKEQSQIVPVETAKKMVKIEKLKLSEDKDPGAVEKPILKPTKTVSKKSDVNNLNVYKAPLKDKHVNSMNEFTQADLAKGVLQSAPEAPADYAMKYKAGIAPARPKRKVSEYAKSFDWKIGGKASPLLAAEQVVYNSNPQVAPFKKDVIPKTSEYNAQFKAWELKDVPVEPLKVQEKSPSGRKSRKTQKVKRSRSLEAIGVSPDRMPPAGSRALVTADNKRCTKEIPEDKPAVPLKYGKLRRTKSEYARNFQAPSCFDYTEGAWHGADPPHLMTEPIEMEAKLSNWFAEVLELRRKAQEYKKRAQGTHFSREHLVQLLAEQTKDWDLQSSARSGPSTGTARSQQSDAEQLQNGYRASCRATVDNSETADVEELEDELEDAEKLARKTAWQEEEAGQQQEEEGSLYSASVGEEVEEGGRIPTPEWKKKTAESKKKKKTRHHLDLTTPSVGGALLSSPPTRSRARGKKPKPAVTKSLPLKLQDLEEKAPETKPSQMKPLAGQGDTSFDVSRGTLETRPTSGLPSCDTHLMRDDDASTDRPLKTYFVDNPLTHKKLRSPMRKVTVPPTLQEGFGQTYSNPHHGMVLTIDGGVPVTRMDDEDVLSLSARSVASSCSLASETLERARKRTQDFWGKAVPAQ